MCRFDIDLSPVSPDREWKFKVRIIYYHFENIRVGKCYTKTFRELNFLSCHTVLE